MSPPRSTGSQCPSLAAVISDTVVPTNASVMATLSEAKKVRHGARQADLGQHVPAARAQYAQHVFKLGSSVARPVAMLTMMGRS